MQLLCLIPFSFFYKRIGLCCKFNQILCSCGSTRSFESVYEYPVIFRIACSKIFPHAVQCFFNVSHESFKDNLVTDKWFDAVISDWKDSDGGKVCIVSINNKEYKFNTDGALIEKEKNLKVALAVAQEAFKTKPKIASDWIDKDRPCAFRYGFAYKGANTRIISKAEALDKLRLHSFGKGFYTMDFEIIQSIGDVALVFCELSESDMF